jgi:hypothetical protein
MKKVLLIFNWVSMSLLIVFVGLYIIVLIIPPKTYMDDSGLHWPNITIIHNSPVVFTNTPSKISTNFPLYKPITIDDPSIHVALAKDRWNGNLIFFNQKSPYVGGITSLTGSNWHSTNEVSEKGFDAYGIYFCLFKDAHRPNTNRWTLMISLWYPIILFGILPAIYAIKKLRAKA